MNMALGPGTGILWRRWIRHCKPRRKRAQNEPASRGRGRLPKLSWPQAGLPVSLWNASGLLRAALADGDQLFARAIKQGPGRKRRGSHAGFTQFVGGQYRELIAGRHNI